jgi:Tol biopolymer transport system component
LYDMAGEDARFPSISRPATASPRLAYQRLVENLDIRRAEIIGGDRPEQIVTSSQPFIASTKSEDHPQYSPDGTKIAFVSRRSGTYEVWLCASDGSNPVRLTSMGGPVVVGPRWSPDGRRIAFFATTGVAGSYLTYVMDADGGRPSRLTRSEGELEALPIWSRTDRSMYLTSGRSGSLQIWKLPLDGGEPVQLTRRGGAEASESPDGRIVYYTKVAEIGPGLWKIPVDGGEEERVLEPVRFGYWAVGRAGIYFIDFDMPAETGRPIKFFDFSSRRIKQLGTVEKTVNWTNTPGFAISPDGRWILYTSLESTDADLMLVDNFRE